jgi:hypothetical protein
MSILLVEFVPQGIIFGADRNITIEGEGIPQFIEESVSEFLCKKD